MSRPRDEKGRFIKPIVASASVIPTTSIENMPRAPMDWQMRAWRLWRLLGVVHQPTTVKAKQVGRVAWNVEVDGELMDEDKAAEVLDAITQPLGVHEAARRLALNLEVAGQVYYTRTSDEWAVVAATVPRLKERLAKADIIVEGIQPDPEDPTKPTSSIQAALGTAEQIRLAGQMSRNQDRSRLHRGILFMPKEMQFPEGDDFQADLEEAIAAAIADEYSPSAASPITVTAPAEYIEKVRHMLIESPYDEKLMERITALVVQFAREIDVPVELLLGNIDSNHWNAWLSSEEGYRNHTEPLASLVGEVFASALKEATGATEFAAARIRVTPDPAELLSRPASFTDAIEALKNGVVGFDYVRRVLGADEDDEPTDDELELIFALQGRTLPGDEPAPQDAPMLPGDAPMPALPEANGNGQPVTAAVDEGDEELDELARRLSDIDFRLLSVLEGLAGMASVHARDRVTAGEVGAQEAVASEMERLGRAWDREVTQARKVLRSLGIDARGDEWDQAQEASVGVLVDGMTEYVITNLEKLESELPALPTPLFREVLATAGGSGTATVAAITSNPAPTFADPQGFAIGVLPLKELKKQDVALVQWRFRYGPLAREHPFHPHKEQDGRFMTSGGQVNGWSPGDHRQRGCLCQSDPVFRKVKAGG